MTTASIPAPTDVEARRASLAAIVERLEEQRALAVAMAESAVAWRTEAGRAVADAVRSGDPARQRRAREALHAAVLVASDASALAFRLTEQRDHYRAMLADTDGR